MESQAKNRTSLQVNSKNQDSVRFGDPLQVLHYVLIRLFVAFCLQLSPVSKKIVIWPEWNEAEANLVRGRLVKGTFA